MFALLAVLAAAVQPAAKGWTFCIAEVGEDVFVTEVFVPTADRVKLEALFAAQLRAGRTARADVQCPAPLEDHNDAINAQSAAIAFQRNLGHKLHAEPALSLRP